MSIEEGILLYVSSNWPHTPVAWPNQSFTPTPGTPFLRAQVVELQPQRLTISGHHRRSWVLNLLLSWPENTGEHELEERVDSLVSLFAVDQVIAGCRVQSLPHRAGSFSDGGWHRKPVIVNLEKLGD